MQTHTHWTHLCSPLEYHVTIRCTHQSLQCLLCVWRQTVINWEHPSGTSTEWLHQSKPICCNHWNVCREFAYWHCEQTCVGYICVVYHNKIFICLFTGVITHLKDEILLNIYDAMVFTLFVIYCIFPVISPLSKPHMTFPEWWTCLKWSISGLIGGKHVTTAENIPITCSETC